MDNLVLQESYKADIIINKFTYYNDFFNKWQNFFQRVYNLNISYTISNINDKDQCYSYFLPFGNTKIDFHFSIKYLRDFFKYWLKNNATITKYS